MIPRAFCILAFACAALGAAPGAAQPVSHTTGVNISDGIPLSADLYVEDNTVLSGHVCIGDDCNDNDDLNGLAFLQIRGFKPWIDFFQYDTSDQFANKAWRIQILPFLHDTNRFGIRDSMAGTVPFVIEGAAPENALRIHQSGRIGLRTLFPQREIHIVDGAFPAIRFEQDTSMGFDPQVWDVFAGPSAIGFFDDSHNTTPFAVEAAAPNDALYVETDGDVGLGTDSPDGKLHTRGDGAQVTYFESANGGPVQVRFRTDSENRRFLAVNNANQVKSQLIFLDNLIKFTGTTDSGANLWMTVGPTGIITKGPTCNPGPCDATFDPEVFTPLPIEDHAAAMWENRYLGAVGPTGPDQPVNLSEKLGGVIHELEVAHIYIEELHADLQNEKARNDSLASSHAEQIAALMALVEAQNARLAALEAAEAR